VHNVITSAAAVEIIREHGGRPIRSRVGHSYMKALMAEHDAAFGGEHSGHYYFRDSWRADTGMLTAMHVLAALGGQDRAPRRGTRPCPPLSKPRTPITRARDASRVIPHPGARPA
jgi:phosphomannomutase